MDTRSTGQRSSSVFVLYRFYGRDDALLYVGLTRDPAARLKKHSSEKLWWSDVTRIEFEHFPDLAALKSAEKAAIIAEQPLHNIQMNGGTKTKTVARDPLEESAIDGLVGRYFHTFDDLDPSNPKHEHATIINGRVLQWQGRVLDQISDDLYTIETFSWLDGCATGHQLAPIDDMLDWRFYDTALEMQVALPCGEYHDHGHWCRGEREFYHSMGPLGLHFICDGCRRRYPGFADYKPLIWRNGKPHLS